MKLIFVLLISFCISMLNPQSALAQEQPSSEKSYQATIKQVIESGTLKTEDQEFKYQVLELQILEGEQKGTLITVQNGSSQQPSQITYNPGELVMVSSQLQAEGNSAWVITDYSRRHALGMLTLLFIFAVLLVGRKWGALSIVGMGFSFLVIFAIILPQIMNGTNPVLISVIASLLIIPVTFYLSHGWNTKTHIAIVSTLLALAFTSLLGIYFVNLAHLTGYSSEEANFLDFEQQGSISIKGLLLAGIIIGTLGILDDITVGQTSVVKQIFQANPSISAKDLFFRAMSVGQDHISSMVNTLVLVYAGASLPLLLLFLDSSKSFLEVINYEIVAEEIIKTLVGSIGLVLVAPVTTFIATLVFTKQNFQLTKPLKTK